jgi:uridine kinase
MDRVSELADKIVGVYKQHSSHTLFTLAISGIDASGKGYIAKLLQHELEKRNYRVANINTDPWQNPIPIRLRNENPAENVYENIFRWNDLFEQLVLPLQKNKRIYLETHGIRTDADVYYPLVYDYNNIDILLVEGILLFKKKYLANYDFTIWIDCSFEVGLQRAIKRNVEKLDENRLRHDYDTFYFAAQRLHFEKDNPQQVADIIFNND